jgi:hypothetical protein
MVRADLARVRVLGFFDVGTIKFRHKPTDRQQQENFSNRSTLTGIGIGAVWDRPRTSPRACRSPGRLSGEAVNDPKKKSRASISSPTRRSEPSPPRRHGHRRIERRRPSNRVSAE